MRIDLNADLGEGCSTDAAILELVSSINIACGVHAGNAETMQNLVRTARARAIAIGAHPSFPDREHFGRREMQLPLPVVRAELLYQIGALDAIARAEGAELAHVKPHGALYNQAAREPELAQCIARAVRDFNPRLKVMALAGSPMIDVLRAEGLQPIAEGFADRGYRPNGQLAPRGTPGALIDDTDAMLAQVLSLVRTGTVTAQDGSLVSLRVDSICLHGDGPHALEFARAIRTRLQQERVEVLPCA